MIGFKPQYTRIKDLSDRRRMPRKGKIRLGVKAISKRTGKEYPKEVPYFVCPPEVKAIYGEQPTTLDIMFPINDPESVFPQAYKHYGQSKGLKCYGDGMSAMEAGDDGQFHQRECPCEKLGKDCNQRAHLMVILPKVDMGGVYQIDVGSINSIIDINSGIDWIRGLMATLLNTQPEEAPFALIPLVLRREPKETHHDQKKQIHYTLKIYGNFTHQQLNKYKIDMHILSPEPVALQAPEDLNPAQDEGATVIYDEEDDADAGSQEVPDNTEDKTETEMSTDYDTLIKQIRTYATQKVITAKEAKEITSQAEAWKKDLPKAIDYLQTQLFAIREGSKKEK